ncbi:sensor domain-containing diguanylate cyclase [Aurantiacibacter suaedae]|uniref:sensor domain-containing diguanylate cyclase n=1 Tax=Aurantiacibacter suaedae TaxID=2545755 RepID=UPI0010F5C097|nr:sensor domain-containing diguanylate cyclase [Aurantiacibacter suaedae]
MIRQSIVIRAESALPKWLRALLRGSPVVAGAIHATAGAFLLAALIAGGDYLYYAAVISLFAMVVQAITSIVLGGISQKRIADLEDITAKVEEQRAQIEQLFGMTDMLQSALSREDAGEVLVATASRLLPDLRGALYIFNNSQDKLELDTMWPDDGFSDPVRSLVPSNCWALKRGKVQINDPHSESLCCKHNGGIKATIEVPMIARGKVHGLLMLASDDKDGAARLRDIARIAQALADSMSLALANISLQEKLRTQSLRDPLTGLYNRRYMEDALERHLQMAERNGNATSVIMIDLDHFKKINDSHGHGKGDAVLRDVAAQLTASVRPSDIVSRYGGEELMVIMPGCDLEDAMAKAEVLRGRIESLSEPHGTPVTASFGVACVPDTSNSMQDLVPMADAALYVAKEAGRNCVKAANLRHSAPPATAAPLRAIPKK